MAIIDTTRNFAPRDTAPAFPLGAAIARLVEAVQGWAAARATRRALAGLSDRELADIGLCRADIERIIAEGRAL